MRYSAMGGPFAGKLRLRPTPLQETRCLRSFIVLLKVQRQYRGQEDIPGGDTVMEVGIKTELIIEDKVGD